VGRASLGVYAIHVPIVYGWSTLEGLSARIGPTLTFGRAAIVGAVVLAASLALARVVQVGRATAAAAWTRRGEAVARVLALVR